LLLGRADEFSRVVPEQLDQTTARALTRSQPRRLVACQLRHPCRVDRPLAAELLQKAGKCHRVVLVLAYTPRQVSRHVLEEEPGELLLQYAACQRKQVTDLRETLTAQRVCESLDLLSRNARELLPVLRRQFGAPYWIGLPREVARPKLRVGVEPRQNLLDFR
jgi:hypothetical protein